LSDNRWVTYGCWPKDDERIASHEPKTDDSQERSAIGKINESSFD